MENGCPRCNGLLIGIGLFDYFGIARYEYAHKCVNCGEILDSVILENRLSHPQPAREIRRGRRRNAVVGRP